MQESNLIAANDNLRKMVADARGLLHVATTVNGEKAVRLHKRGMRLLDMALVYAQPKKNFGIGKGIALSTTQYMKDNPLNAIAAAVCFWVITVFIIGFNN
jgi:hypothetical protein